MWFIFLIAILVIYYLYKNKKRKNITKIYDEDPEASRLFYSEFIQRNNKATDDLNDKDK